MSSLAKVYSGTVVGLEGQLVEVEVGLFQGLPKFTVVGLPDAAVQESRERVKFAIKSAGFFFPTRHLTASLAPSDVRKAGPIFDLPIAVGVAIATDQLIADVGDSLFLGELSLDGRLRHSQGVLPMVSLARDSGLRS